MIGQLKLKNALMFASSLAANENEKKSADLMIQKIGIQAHKRGGLSEMQALFEKAAGRNQNRPLKTALKMTYQPCCQSST